MSFRGASQRESNRVPEHFPLRHFAIRTYREQDRKPLYLAGLP
jgi:hypothetical protein